MTNYFTRVSYNMRTKRIGGGLIIMGLAMLLTGCMVNIGVTVTGLTSTGLVLQNNSSDDLIVNADGNFTFSTQIASGGTYAVTVKTQPSGQLCAVGNGSGTASLNGNTINVQCATNVLQLLAGGLGGNGNADGTGVAARFSNPYGIAIDSTGNAYVADTNNNTIRKITPAGVVTTLAGAAGNLGSTDGIGAAARFAIPYGIAVDNASNIYVADMGNSTIRKITPAGVVTTLAGSPGNSGRVDGTGADARFYEPQGIAVDNTGNVYVADTQNYAIRKISPAGVVTTLAGAFNLPSGVAVDSAGNVYVADTMNNSIREISPAGVVTTLAGTAGDTGIGSADGTGAAAQFDMPTGVAVDSAGNVYVADLNDTIRKISPAGVVTTLAGSAGSTGTSDGTGATATFNRPFSVAVDSMGNVYVADTMNNIIRKISPAGEVTTLAGASIRTGSTDDPSAAARFYLPMGIAADSEGTVFVADYWNDTIRRISPTGEVTTLAGMAGSTGNTDGVGATARFNFPTGIAVDSADNVYVADFNSSIRIINPAGVVTTLAGAAGYSGSSDGIGATARFSNIYGIAIDSSGNVYVADSGNNTIRKVNPAGMVTTLAGAATYSGSTDGIGTTARFNFPTGVAVDSADNVYVADSGNNTIRKISPWGVVTTLAGTAGIVGSADGSGAAAGFNNPHSVAADSAGNVYVADLGNSTIRKVDPAGVVTTVIGSANKIGAQLGTLPASLGARTVGVAVSEFRLFTISENAILWSPIP